MTMKYPLQGNSDFPLFILIALVGSQKRRDIYPTDETNALNMTLLVLLLVSFSAAYTRYEVICTFRVVTAKGKCFQH